VETIYHAYTCLSRLYIILNAGFRYKPLDIIIAPIYGASFIVLNGNKRKFTQIIHSVNLYYTLVLGAQNAISNLSNLAILKRVRTFNICCLIMIYLVRPLS